MLDSAASVPPSSRRAFIAGGLALGGALSAGVASPRSASASATEPAASDGRIFLDDGTGSDDDKLTAALSVQAADTNPRVIQLPHRGTHFQILRTGAETTRLVGPVGTPGVPEQGASTSNPAIWLDMAGAWFTFDATSAGRRPYGAVFGPMFHNLTFSGGTNATIWDTADGTFPYAIWMHNIAMVNMRSYIGGSVSSPGKALVTFLQMDGWQSISNCQRDAIWAGGSEAQLFTDGALIDSSAVAGQWANSPAHLRLDGSQHVLVGPAMITCQGNWIGVVQTGAAHDGLSTDNSGNVTYFGTRIEGKSASEPSNNCLAYQIGGLALWDHAYFGNALASPTETWNNLGYVVVEGRGAADFNVCTFNRRASVAADTDSMIHVTGDAYVDIRGTKRLTRSNVQGGDGRWLKDGELYKPRVSIDGAFSESLSSVDGSMTKVVNGS